MTKQNKNFIFILIIIASLGIITYFSSYSSFSYLEKPTVRKQGPLDISYNIGGQKITLTNGYHASTNKYGPIITRYFGNMITADLNGDGLQDRVLIITQQTDSDNILYYVVASLYGYDIYRSTNSILLGSNIAPQTTEFRDGYIIVNYAERNPGEPITTPPSLGVSKYLKVEEGKLVEVGKP